MYDLKNCLVVCTTPRVNPVGIIQGVQSAAAVIYFRTFIVCFAIEPNLAPNDGIDRRGH